MHVGFLNNLHYAGNGVYFTICYHERKVLFMLADEKERSCVRGFMAFLHQKLHRSARDTLLSSPIQHAGIQHAGIRPAL